MFPTRPRRTVIPAFLAALVLCVPLASCSSNSLSDLPVSDPNAEPGSGPDFKGKRSSDIGAEYDEPVSFNDITFTASEVEYFESDVMMSSYCTTVSIENNSGEPFAVAPEDFAMRLSFGTSNNANGLNDVDRLEDQLIPDGGSTEGSLCYAVPSVVDADEPTTFVYEGDALDGTYIGWGN